MGSNISREKKFTPGPWVVDYGRTIGHIKAIINSGSRVTPTVAKYESTACPEWEQKANANLIASAPELLEALEGLCKLCYDGQHNRLVQGDMCKVCSVNLAIKKAYGETP